MRRFKVLKLKFLLTLRDLYNFFLRLRKPRAFPPSGLAEFDDVLKRAGRPTDFSDHLQTLFTEGLSSRPRLIVELGTRGGDSTFVLERVAKLCGATFLSVDIADCSGSCQYPQWIFVQSDDVAFARQFPAWCAQRGLEPRIDLLFIDTSHEYAHTVQEIRAWFPLLSDRAKAIFHDTNMRFFYFRADHSLDIGWDNQRGVIRAVEEYLGRPLDEAKPFTVFQKPWMIRHWPNCSGFTVLDKVL